MNVLASCDSKYFIEHHKAFYRSAKSVGHTPFIVVINPTDQVREIASTLDNVSFMQYKEVSKVLYSVNRFIIAESFIGREQGVLVTDIDCFFNKKLPPIKEDIGLFLREKESFGGMKVAAGVVWFGPTEKGVNFCNTVKDKIMSKPWEWYVDQYALYETYLEHKNNLSIFKFNMLHMDWEFTKNSYMWTGKGPRKYKNSTYLNRKRALEK